MRVAVNARLLSSPNLRGWNRYTINLLAELANLGLDLFLYTDHLLHESHLRRLPTGSYCVRVAPRMRYFLWEQQWLPRQCALDKVSLLHTPFNFGLPWASPCPQVLTLHDAIDQLYYDRQASWRQKLRPACFKTRLYHWIARTRAHAIITVSNHARSDLISLGIPPEKVSVIYEAADARFHEPISKAERRRIREQHRLVKPYIFYVGGYEQRKRIPFLVSAFAAARLENAELALAGAAENHRDNLARLGDSLGIGSSLRILGRVEDADLPALYAEALCFVYPSEYEGFGLQLCEAMAVGCPTLASRVTSLPEVLSSGGETFNPLHPRELVSQLKRVAHDSSFRDILVRKARMRAVQFSWQRTARETVAVYGRLLKARRGRYTSDTLIA